MFDLLLKNGTIVTDTDTFRGDIAVRDGKIVAVGGQMEEESTRVIDLTGKHILPGVIDGHIHCMCPFMGCQGPNDFYKTSIAGAFGGVTMFIDFTNTEVGKSVYDATQEKLELMEMSAVDYALHAKVVEGNEQTMADLRKLVDMGIPTFKMFMTYRKDGIMCDDATMIKVFKVAKKIGALPMLHCESNALAEDAFDACEARGDLSWRAFAEAKPGLCEAEAFTRAYYYAKSVGCPIMAVHTTVKEALDVARKAHEEDFPLYVETCPHYLTLFKDRYDAEDGYLAICSPPLRTPKDAADVWDALKDGTISITGSDDCTYTREEKSRFLKKDGQGKWIQDFRAVVNGNSGIETRLPILLSEGVGKGHITLNQLVALTSTNIAKIYGCYPRKGCIQAGADADFAIVDLDKTWTLSKDTLHNNLDYCLFEGMEVKGMPVMTIAHGKVIVENGAFTGSRGEGKFVSRRLDPEILKRYSALAPGVRSR
ncbi:MAG: dihydropyrimidinase [Intestinimonas sp.]|jgi:dihydropyrimidinase|nr:dihydropyrimidinase [Intestinimonas sp.]